MITFQNRYNIDPSQLGEKAYFNEVVVKNIRYNNFDDVFFIWDNITLEQYLSVIGPHFSASHNTDYFPSETIRKTGITLNQIKVYNEAMKSVDLKVHYFRYVKSMIDFIKNYMEKFEHLTIEDIIPTPFGSSTNSAMVMGHAIAPILQYEFGFLYGSPRHIVKNIQQDHIEYYDITFGDRSLFGKIEEIFRHIMIHGNYGFRVDNVCLNKKDFKVEFFQNKKDFAKFHKAYEVNHNKTLKLGKAIKKAFGDMISDAVIERMVGKIVENHGVMDYNDLHFHMSMDAANFVYATTQPMPEKHFGNTSNMIKAQSNSCMRYNPSKYNVKTHPANAYASGDFMVAYLSDSADPLDPNAKTYARCYIGMQNRADHGSVWTKHYTSLSNQITHVYTICPTYNFSASVATFFMNKIKDTLENETSVVRKVLGDDNVRGISTFTNGLTGLKLRRIVEKGNLIMPYVDHQLYLNKLSDDMFVLVESREESVVIPDLDSVPDEFKKDVDNSLMCHVSNIEISGIPYTFEKQKLKSDLVRLFPPKDIRILKSYPPARVSGGQYVAPESAHCEKAYVKFDMTVPYATPKAYAKAMTPSDFETLPTTYFSRMSFVEEDLPFIDEFKSFDVHTCNFTDNKLKEFKNSPSIRFGEMDSVISRTESHVVEKDFVFSRTHRISNFSYQGKRYHYRGVKRKNSAQEIKIFSTFDMCQELLFPINNSLLTMREMVFRYLYYPDGYKIHYHSDKSRLVLLTAEKHDYSMKHYNQKFYKRLWELTFHNRGENRLLGSFPVYRVDDVFGDTCGDLDLYDSAAANIYKMEVKEVVPRKSIASIEDEVDAVRESTGDRPLEGRLANPF